MAQRLIGVLLLLVILTIPSTAALSYDYTCSRDAKRLKNAADDLESAVSEYESAKSSYESACNAEYGYSNDDESACGSYGYERSSYEDALERLKSAEDELEYALDRVNRTCGSRSRSLDPMTQACLTELSNVKSQLGSCISGKAKDAEE